MEARARSRSTALAALAAIVLTSAGVVAVADAAHAVGARTISGHITLPAGSPDSYYSNIHVAALGDDLVGNGYDDVVGTDGNFSITGLANGTYVVWVTVEASVEGSEYVPIPVAAQYYPASFSRDDATHVDATAADPEPLAITLGPAGIISGHVSIDAALNPAWLSSVLVHVSGANGFSSPNHEVKPDGTYAVWNVPPGQYKVSFDAGPYWNGTEYVGTDLKDQYYNDVYAFSAAELVTVTASHTTANIDAVMTDTARFTLSPAPTIKYTKLIKGAQLGFASGVWSPVPSLTYQWKRNGSPISGATNSTYELTSADVTKKITLTVTASAAGYATVTRTSAAVTILKSFTTTYKPTITGTGKAGYTLTAHRGTWSPTPSYAYQWYRNGVKISGATSSSYKVRTSDKGTKITVTVTGKRNGYSPVTNTSATKTIAN